MSKRKAVCIMNQNHVKNTLAVQYQPMNYYQLKLVKIKNLFKNLKVEYIILHTHINIWTQIELNYDT